MSVDYSETATQTALWFYENFLIEQSHIPCAGLWAARGEYLIVCPTLETAIADDGLALPEWFRNNRPVVGLALRLVSDAPTGDWKRLVPRPISSRAELRGIPRNRAECWSDLRIALPPEFPELELETSLASATVRVARSLTEPEQDQLERAYAKLDLPLNLEVEVAPPKPCVDDARKMSRRDVYILVSRALPAEYSGVVRVCVEDDEDFWRTSRRRLFSEQDTEVQAKLPADFAVRHARCVVDASTDAGNLRAYMPLYAHVAFVAPSADRYQEALAGLRVSEDDLVSLSRDGRIGLLFPHSIDRYPSTLVNKLAECAPDSFMLSRRLCAATVADARARFPFLYPSLGMEERRRILDEMWAGSANDPLLGVFASVARYSWVGVEELLHRRGAVATSAIGVGSFAAELYKKFTGRDLRLELIAASTLVEWGGTLGATVFPRSKQQKHAEFSASLYAGIPAKPVPIEMGEVLSVGDELLGIANDAPVLDVARAFSGKEVDRLRSLVLDLTARNQDPQTRAEAIAELNSRVERYEKRSERRDAFELLTGAGALLAFTSHAHTGAYLTFAAWVARVLLRNIDGGVVGDFARGLVTASGSTPVLISRLRSKLGKLRK